jgi:glycosyltransferase involved in cell wall biosynthesis
MPSSRSPLVSVVIPVYNGERVIGDAIRSVLAQTYENFELTIANNCSTDHTASIAEEFTRLDSRVRLFNATEFVSVVGSHNRAFTLISDDADYCKILGADDWLYPECIAELVAVAESNPTAAMVSSYFLSGGKASAGPPFPDTFFTGREICRLRLLEDIYAFGGPSASLIRASVVREKRPFYNPDTYHGDVDAYLDVFQRYDFGFVHQILSYSRRGERSPTTAYLHRVNAYEAERVDELVRFGALYLTPEERRRRLRKARHEYYSMLAWNLFQLRGREFWDYHLNASRKLGYSLSYSRLAVYAVLRVLDVALNPLRTIKNVGRRVWDPFDQSSDVGAPAPTGTLTPTHSAPARPPKQPADVIQRSRNAFHRV